MPIAKNSREFININPNNPIIIFINQNNEVTKITPSDLDLCKIITTTYVIKNRFNQKFFYICSDFITRIEKFDITNKSESFKKHFDLYQNEIITFKTKSGEKFFFLAPNGCACECLPSE